MSELSEKLEKAGEKLQKGVEAINKNTDSTSAAYSYQNVGKAVSDEHCKMHHEMHKKFSDCVANIDAYLFKYKPSAQKKYGVDDKEHVGVMAQELEENPVTKPSVMTMEDGHKEVDIKELTLENAALIADLVRRVQKLEEK